METVGRGPLLLETPIIIPKHEPLSQEMHLKILLFSQGLKFSNSTPSCRVISTSLQK
jgi:hypothetical protein